MNCSGIEAAGPDKGLEPRALRAAERPVPPGRQQVSCHVGVRVPGGDQRGADVGACMVSL